MPPEGFSGRGVSSAPVAPDQSSNLPYRVRATGSTLAAFDNYRDATKYAEQFMREFGAVEIVFSMAAI
jgi:hypothetical protein